MSTHRNALAGSVRQLIAALILLALVAAPVAAQPRVDERAAASWEGERASSGKRVRVTGGTPVLLRGGPGAEYAIVATSHPGEELLLAARVGSWYAVETEPGHTAWIGSTRIEEVDADLHFLSEPHRYHRQRSFVFTPVSGLYSAEQQSNTAMIGGRLGYYLTDRFEAEAGLGFTRVRRERDTVEELFALHLEESSYQVLHYQANLIMHVITGRRLGPFVTAGVGTATSDAKTELAWNAGAGMLLFVNTDTAARIEFRNYHFKTGNQFTRRTVDNIEAVIGVSFLF
jgi:outer membrane beta-barrel protein